MIMYIMNFDNACYVMFRTYILENEFIYIFQLLPYFHKSKMIRIYYDINVYTNIDIYIYIVYDI